MNTIGYGTSHYNIKTVVIGNYSTGKTTLVTRLTNGKIKPFTESTIGCAFSSLHRISKHGTPVQYQIWDTAGQEKYRAMTELYYRNADIIIICFDVSDRKSLNDVTTWIDLINDGCSNKDHIRYLIANKDDLHWNVNRKEVEKLATTHNMTLIVTSAIENRGIDVLLDDININVDTKWRGELINYVENHNDTIVIPTLKNNTKCCNYL